jgi:hypothetical protein
MNLKYIKKELVSLLKIISTVLSTGAIGLELWNIYALINNMKVPSSLDPIFWIERFALTVHFVEGVIAAFYAPSKQKLPVRYGTYTFVVGTIGLLELFAKDDD